jgi:hypothetical protein
VSQLTRPSERFLALLEGEMDRLSSDARHFRVFLEYWTIGVRKGSIRRKVASALDVYRTAFQEFAETAVEAAREVRSARARLKRGGPLTSEALAAAAVSLVHGCALQAVIAPRQFDVQRHKDAAVRLLAELA